MRPMSETAIRETQKRSSSAMFPCLISITHSYVGLASPLRLCNNNVALTYQGDVYLPFNFDIVLPGRSEDGTRINARLTIDAVDTRVAEILLSVSSPPIVRLVAAFMLNGTTPVFESLASYDHTFRKISGTMKTITGELITGEYFDLEFPAGDMNPVDFPGLF